MPAPQSGISALVAGVGHYLPERVVTTDEVVARVNEASGRKVVTSRIIQALTGVEERRFAEPGTTSSELAALAGRAALEHAGRAPEDVDLLIFAAVTQDVIEPATSSILQERLGCWNASVFDVKNACNSFVNAVDVAAAKIIAGQSRRALVTTGEVASVHIAWQIGDAADAERKLPSLTIGDGGGAFLLEAAEGAGRGVLPGLFLSDGREWRLSTILSGGTLLPGDTEHFHMECDGPRLHQLGLERVPGALDEILRRTGWTHEEVKLGVPHQTSVHTIEEIRAKAGFRPDQGLVTVDRLGNTGAASIPIGVSLAAADGRLETGDKVLLVGGAAGFGVAIIPLIWTR
jgi:acyl-CoA:acyl-CoA alkyltransferase